MGGFKYLNIFTVMHYKVTLQDLTDIHTQTQSFIAKDVFYSHKFTKRLFD